MIFVDKDRETCSHSSHGNKLKPKREKRESPFVFGEKGGSASTDAWGKEGIAVSLHFGFRLLPNIRSIDPNKNAILPIGAFKLTYCAFFTRI